MITSACAKSKKKENAGDISIREKNQRQTKEGDDVLRR
jgi:hypothetical protein